MNDNFSFRLRIPDHQASRLTPAAPSMSTPPPASATPPPPPPPELFEPVPPDATSCPPSAQPSPESFETKHPSDNTQAEVDTCPGLPVAGPAAPNLTSTPSIPAATVPFRPLDFLPAFLVGIENGAVFHTSAGTRVLSSIQASDDSITDAQVRAAHEIVMQYSRPPGLSPNINLDRIQQFVVFLAEIVKFHPRADSEGNARYTAYELGNAVAALQQALESKSPSNGK